VAENVEGLMPKRSHTNRTPNQRINVLDTTLLDLFAQVESLLRSGRNIQRHAIRLRDGNGAKTAEQRRPVIEKIRDAVEQIGRDLKNASGLVRAMRSAAKDLE
jgi:hypothetical protein